MIFLDGGKAKWPISTVIAVNNTLGKYANAVVHINCFFFLCVCLISCISTGNFIFLCGHYHSILLHMTFLAYLFKISCI